MVELERVSSAYGHAWKQVGVIVSVHLATRLLTLAIVTPAFGLALALALSLSSQTALTDQDIARFLMTPLGAISGLLIAALFLLSAVFSFAVMSVHLCLNDRQGLQGIPADLGFLATRWRALITFAVLFVLRVLTLVAPAALISLVIAVRNITEYDINYYLTERPPEFITTVLIIGALLSATAVVLLNRLLTWSVALHYVLFHDTPPSKAFKASGEHLEGSRFLLLRSVIVWYLVRLALAAGVGAVAGVLLSLVPGSFSSSLTTALTVSLAVMAIWGLALTVVSAIALGALAKLLLAVFGDVPGAPEPAAPSELRVSPAVLAAAIVGLAVIGIFGAAQLLEEVQADDDVLIIAHRGGAIARPENTMAAIIKGVDDGADWIEIDVQETADGEVVVVHDSDFMKVAGNPIKIWDATMSDLAEIDIGGWFDPSYSSERTVTLAAALEAVRDRAVLLIELKYYGHDVDLENRVIGIVEDAGMADQVAIMSLKYPAVQKMLSLRPDWPTGVLAATAIGDLTGLEGDFIAVSTTAANGPLARRAGAAGKDLYVWTVNDALSMSAMISMGVSGLITDDPALANQVLAERADMSTPQRLALLLTQRFGVTLSLGAEDVVEQ